VLKGVLCTLSGNFPFLQAPTRVGAGHPSGERHPSSYFKYLETLSLFYKKNQKLILHLDSSTHPFSEIIMMCELFFLVFLLLPTGHLSALVLMLVFVPCFWVSLFLLLCLL
jgi:hypothetical protein